MTTCLFSIVVPTYNSSQTIRTLCKEILSAEPNAEVVIVDDNSPDGTGLIADEIAASCPRVKILHRRSRLGVGSAVYEGIQCATSDMVVVMDSDLHHPVSVLPKMIELLRSGYDLVIASRYAKGSQFICSSVLRLLVNKLGNKAARRFLGVRVEDCTHGFRAYRKSVFLNSFDKSFVDGTFNIVVLANAWRHGFKVAEVPCSSVHLGKSNAGAALRYSSVLLRIARRRIISSLPGR